MSEPLTVGYDVTKWVKNADTKVISLHRYGQSGQNLSMLDPNQNNIAYKVPVGKKLIILNCQVGGNGSWTLRHNNITNSTTGSTFIFSMGASSNHVAYIPMYVEVPENHYIIAYTYSTSWGGVFGVECNA